MTKVSTNSAANHRVFPGFVEEYEQEVGDWTVSLERDLCDMDLAPFFRGAPDDLCQASHMGYVIKGRFGARMADGSEEIYSAGDAFVLAPGHVPLMFADSEFVAFTPTEDARQQAAVMMPNVERYAREHGIELPEGATAE